MLKQILNLKGAQQLSKKEQQSINGGELGCIDECYNANSGSCPGNEYCHVTWCKPAGPNDPYTIKFGVCIGNNQ